MMRLIAAGFLLLALALTAGAAPLQLIDITSHANGNGNNYYWSLGYSFQTDSDIAITALGNFDFIDFDYAYRITSPQTVALWTAGGVLLASVTVDGSEPLAGTAPYRFRYRDITPVNLAAGATYVLSSQGTLGAATGSAFIYQATLVPQPGITWLESRIAYAVGGPVPLFPGGTFGDPTGYFGPNALFGPIENPIPEPASLATVAFGLVICLLARPGTSSLNNPPRR